MRASGQAGGLGACDLRLTLPICSWAVFSMDVRRDMLHAPPMFFTCTSCRLRRRGGGAGQLVQSESDMSNDTTRGHINSGGLPNVPA